MKTAKDIMEKEVISITPETDISRAVELLLNNHINGVPVVDGEGKLKGILCQSDLIFQQKTISLPPILTFLDGIIPLSSSKKLEQEMKKIAAGTVAQAMVTDPVTVAPDTLVSDIAAMMVEKHFHTIPVVQDGKVVGVVGKEDVLRTLIKS
nr:CBS domain-containing protein [uncultured Desulfobacter sp.]